MLKVSEENHRTTVSRPGPERTDTHEISITTALVLNFAEPPPERPQTATSCDGPSQAGSNKTPESPAESAEGVHSV